MPNVGPTELLIVLIVAVVILGPKRIPEAAKSIGKGIRGFKSTVDGKEDSPKLDAKSEEKEKVDS